MKRIVACLSALLLALPLAAEVASSLAETQVTITLSTGETIAPTQSGSAETEAPAATLTATPTTAPTDTPAPTDTLAPTDAPEPTPAPTEAPPTLKYGDQGEAVSELQSRLSELGYYVGRISGNFLEGTQNGVKRFQKDYGLEVTGELDPESAEVLEKAEYRSLRYGDDGDDVKRLQTVLRELGYLDANSTGKYRAATQEAVADFQEAMGVEATGEADLETQRLLFGDTALAKGAQPTPTPDPDADLGDINDVVMVEDGASTPDSMGTSEYGGQKLQRGDQGEEVKQVQTRLTELGFFTGPISGNYMNQTIAAVKAFQEHNGMFVTGETDEETWNMLFNSSDVLDISATARPTPVPTPVPYAITVDVRNQVTTVYGLDENGEYTVPVKQMVCSTGMKATPSDVGEWVLNGRKARWCYFPTWGSHAQYWTRINDSIAFHSVIYNSVDLNNMSTKSYNLLGSRASHGCIRLLVSDAKWIYDNVGEGVVVTVTEDLPDDEELRKAVAAPPLNSSKTGPVTTPEPTPAPVYVSGATPPQPFEKLKKGAESEAVYWLQCRLKELGYYSGTVTGGYYSGTQKAVKAFQKANGIYATGTADVETLEAIYADVLDPQATPPVTPTPEPTPEPTPSLTPAPTTEPGKTSNNNA